MPKYKYVDNSIALIESCKSFLTIYRTAIFNKFIILLLDTAMALELRQQMKMTQQLVMTQQLQQAISLLQLSRLELMDTISSEMLENPFLEESFDEIPQDHEFIDKKSDDESVYDKEISNTADWEDYLGDLSSTPRTSSAREFEALDEMTSYEARYATKTSLDSHLMWQLHLSDFSENEILIGEAIIGNLDDRGFLVASVDEIIQQLEQDNNFFFSDVLVNESKVLENHDILSEIQQKQDKVEQVLSVIQNFDPIGVASRSVQESLLVQVKNLKYDRDPILLELITVHLEDLEAKRYKPIMKKFKIDEEILFEYIQLIKTLDPMPGSAYSDVQSHYVAPDVYVYKVDDDFVIVLNEDGIPQLQLSEIYSQMPVTHISSEQKDFLSEKQKAATWLIKAIYQRQKTLYKVIESIVKYQQEFFANGVTKLKPLILKTVAEDIGMHESTISRITTNKYVATSFGTYEIKFFFNSGLVLEDGNEVGSESVKAAIKKYIAAEDPKSPLSDEKLCEILKNELGVEMARRTVAKYRTALDIPSSSRRKSFF